MESSGTDRIGAFFYGTIRSIICIFAPTLLYSFINSLQMGRGDKKTKKGKIFKASFGKSRPARTKKAAPAKKDTK